ncbi:DUF998 domain-containing protein [Devosia aquimaris]|uniref:DUF998 domain-containing protein n=1 Tax=Devosia aquimaris TaxID=2866214 RepID=UPI001CD0BE7F|nr:DUF998 domain-containing protein [Devosia sp. CJK-A8-3]
MSLTRLLLACGIVGAAFFIAMDFVSSFWLYPGYDYTAQQVSELSAIGAPSRNFWMAMGFPYAGLSFAFALGVWRASAGRVSLRTTAVLIGLFALNSFVWGWVAPMHMRGTVVSTTDTMHIVLTIVAVVLMVTFMTTGASAFGRGFRLFSILTMLAMVVAGGVVGTQISAIAQGLPTPWMGLVERVSVYAPSLWMTVLAVMLLRGNATARIAKPGAMRG